MCMHEQVSIHEHMSVCASGHVASACTDRCQVSKAVHGISCFLPEGHIWGGLTVPGRRTPTVLLCPLGLCHSDTSSKKLPVSLSSQHRVSSPPDNGLMGPLPQLCCHTLCPPAPWFVVPAVSPALSLGLVHRMPWDPVCPRQERIRDCVQTSSTCYILGR